ncbi:hypothetical protein N7494_000237 [Penicillium frequentans]|uniref:Alpha/beta hydrolase fold-3 domain-containing protein n=1 Tax=Penicillium frequentans TaxID=3151616 RepID=A0AAD6GLD9_9EURO|nr:hypothetical protein N7494_000237 [Penicillium glabrum]
MLDAVSRVGITETLTLNPGKEGKRFQTVPVSTSDVYKGPLASKTVKPATIGGTWYPDAPGSQIISKTVVLYFHRGAFVQGDGRTEQCGVVAKYFLDKGTADAVFCLQYRLSGHGGLNPFPAALQDALSSYLFLLHSGANLTAALLRYLYEFGSTINIPTPTCAVLLSPWVEPFYLNPVGNPQRSTDFVPATYGAWGAYAYAGSCPEPWANPYITHLGHPFPTPVALFVNEGTSELFFERITRWAMEMRGIEGNVVELHHEEDAVHDTYLIGQLIGFEESAWGVAAKVAEFVQNL